MFWSFHFFRHYICVHSLLSLFLHFFFLSHCAAAFLAPSVCCFDPGFQWAQTVSNLLHAPPIECLLLVFFFSLNFVPLFFLTNFCAAILYVMYEIIFLVWTNLLPSSYFFFVFLLRMWRQCDSEWALFLSFFFEYYVIRRLVIHMLSIYFDMCAFSEFNNFS